MARLSGSIPTEGYVDRSMQLTAASSERLNNIIAEFEGTFRDGCLAVLELDGEDTILFPRTKDGEPALVEFKINAMAVYGEGRTIEECAQDWKVALFNLRDYFKDATCMAWRLMPVMFEDFDFSGGTVTYCIRSKVLVFTPTGKIS